MALFLISMFILFLNSTTLVRANITIGYTDPIAAGGYVQRSGPPIQLFGIGATSSSGSDTLTSINVDFSGTGFNTGNLLSLSTNSATSGVGVYRDTGTTGTADDNYDSSDTPITLATCAWSGNQVQITFSSEPVPTTITGKYQWIIVMRTSNSMTNLEQIIATINVNQITYSDGTHQPVSQVSTATMTALVGPIYIQSDGSIAPTGDPRITASGTTYTLTMDVNDQIIIQRSGITLDGNNHKLQDPSGGSWNGIYISSGVDHVTVQHTEIIGFNNGLYIDGVSSYDTITNNNIHDCADGIRMVSGSLHDITISSNTMTNNNGYNAILIYGYGTTNHLVFAHNTISGTHAAMQINSVPYTTIDSNTLTGADGVQVYGGSDNTQITNNNINTNEYPIDLGSSVGCTITGNTLTSASGVINLAGNSVNPVQNCLVSSNIINCPNTNGIILNWVQSSTMSGNTINIGSNWGFSLTWSDSNTISSNTFVPTSASARPNGITLSHSNHNTIHNNQLTAPTSAYGYATGIQVYSSTDNQITGNTLQDCAGTGIYIESADHQTISGNTITDLTSGKGIWIYGSAATYNTITQNTIDGQGNTNTNGILLDSSANLDTISQNSIQNNRWGLELSASASNNQIENNIITGNEEGFYLITGASSNTLINNKVTGNQYGVYISYSSSNSIYNNDFVSNTVAGIYQGPSDPSTNTWDNGYANGGNYWSNYAGVDVKKGSTQTDPGADGFGDTPYGTTYGMVGSNKDNYPFMTVFFDLSGVGTDVPGTIFSVDGTPYTAPVSFMWSSVGTHSFQFNSPLVVDANAKQYVWTGTVGLSTFQGDGSLNVPYHGKITASYKTQYKVNFDASSNVRSDSTATVLLVGGNPVTLPYTTGWLDSGVASLSYAFQSPVASSSSPSDTRYVWASTSGLSQTLQTNTFTVTAAGTVSAVYNTQYKVSFVVYPSGAGLTDPSGTGIWEDTRIPISVPTTYYAYALNQWTSNTGSITFDNDKSGSTYANIAGPGTITANLVIPTTIRILSDGTITPSDAPITTSDGIHYSVIFDIIDYSNPAISVEKSGITLNGANHKVIGLGNIYWWSPGVQIKDSASSVTISNFEISGCQYGIHFLGSTSNNLASSNTIHDCGVGICFQGGSPANNVVDSNIFTNNRLGIHLGTDATENDDFTLSGNTITTTYGDGVELECSLRTNIYGNTINVLSTGISVLQRGSVGSDYTNIHDNSITSHVSYSNAILVSYSNHVTINHNTIRKDGDPAIIIDHSQNDVLSNNDIQSSSTGISITQSSHVEVFGNPIYGSGSGADISLGSSSNIELHGNTLGSIGGGSPAGLYMISSNNNNIHDNTFSNLYSYAFWLTSSSTNQIVNNGITCPGGYGINLENSDHNTISGNHIASVQEGIRLIGASSAYNEILNNDIGSCTDHGMDLLNDVNNNQIHSNNIHDNYYGFHLYTATSNTIYANHVTGNTHGGIWIQSSGSTLASNNLIYGNDFISNTPQIIQDSSDAALNTWDNGYPTGGNYWSNYAGVDVKKGSTQTDSGADGFGDTPYDTTYGMVGSNKDNYPFMTVFFNQVGVGTDFTGTIVRVDGVDHNAPVSFMWSSTSTHSFQFYSPLVVDANAKQYVWTGTVGLSTLQGDGSLNVPYHGSITASYKTQYKVIFDASSNVKGDSSATIVTVGGSQENTGALPFTTDWIDSGGTVTWAYSSPVASSSSPSNTQYKWASTSGLGQSGQSGTLTVTASGTVTGTYDTQYKISFDVSSNVKSDSSATILLVGGSPVTLPYTTGWLSSGVDSLTYAFQSPIASSGSPSNTQYIWSSTGGLSQTLQSNTFTVAARGTISAVYNTQYKVTFDASSNVMGDSSGNLVTVNSVGHTLPFTTGWLTSGVDSLTYAFVSPVASSSSPSNTQYVWSSTSGLGQALQTNTFTVSSAGTVTGSYKTQYLVTFAQSGLSNDASGTVVTVAGAAKTFGDLPFTVWVDASSGSVTYSYTATVPVNAGKQYVKTSTDNSPVTGLSGPVTVTGSYKTQWYVIFAVSPSGAGSTVPSGANWYDDAFTINPISASPTGGYAFSSWSSSSVSIVFGSSGSSSTTATIGGAGTITANFVATVGITVTSSPAGSGFVMVDGVAITTPATFTWAVGEQHTLTANSPVSGTGVQYVYTGWSDGGGQGHTYTVQSASDTVTANYKVQWLVTFSQSGVGSDAGSNTVLTIGTTNYGQGSLPQTNVWVDDGTAFSYAGTVAVSGTKQYIWTSNTGGLTSPVHAAGSVTGNYKTQYQVSFSQTGISSDAGSNTVLAVGSTNYAYNALPNGVWVDSGTTFSWSSPVAGVSGERFVKTGDSGLASPIVTSGTDTATYKTQWQVTFEVSPSGAGSTAPSGTNWYDNAFTIDPLSATPTTGFTFASWSSSTNSIVIDSTSSSTTTATISGTGTITANFVPTFVVPEYALGALLALAACFAAFAIIKRPKLNLRHK